jgi:hypothetical protein
VTTVTIPGIPPEYCEDVDENELLVAAASSDAREQIRHRVKDQFQRGRLKYNPETQPRDATGKFRRILARLKSNLGDTELEQIVREIKTAERLSDTGDYRKASDSATKVVAMIDKIESGALDQGVEKSLRTGAADLGRVLAYLPLPQGVDTAKVRFSDLPPSTAQLIRNMIKRVDEKLVSDKATKITAVLQSFISGVRSMSADELSAELNKLLRFLV